MDICRHPVCVVNSEPAVRTVRGLDWCEHHAIEFEAYVQDRAEHHPELVPQPDNGDEEALIICLLAQPALQPEMSGVLGSRVSVCQTCRNEIWIAPSSSEFLASRFPGTTRVLCQPCAFEVIQTEQTPEEAEAMRFYTCPGAAEEFAEAVERGNQLNAFELSNAEFWETFDNAKEALRKLAQDKRDPG